MTTTTTIVAKATESVAAKAARLDATKLRVATRLEKAEISLLKAKDSLARAEERIRRRTAKLEALRVEGPKLIAKQEGELAKATERAKLIREKAERVPVAPTARPSVPAGTVETEQGIVFSLDKATIDGIKKVLGRKRKGVLRPLDGEPAQAILSVLDAAITGDLGDTFQVQIKGRKGIVVFSVEAEGLAFGTV